MTEKLLKEIASSLSSIETNIPNETSLWDVEQKLDRMIELLERQNEISDSITDRLDGIDNNIPREINTSLIENRLERIFDKLDEMNIALSDINYNTHN